MPTIQQIMNRARSLRNETALNSISPERAGGIMYDTLAYINEMQLQGANPLLLSKIYDSVAEMEADPAPVSDLDGSALLPGQLVCIVTGDPDDPEDGLVYRYDGTEDDASSWTAVGRIGSSPYLEGFLYMGKAVLTPTPTDPGAPTQKVFYEASEPGTYGNFGNLVVNDGESVYFKFDGDAWSKEVTGFVSADKVSELGWDLNKNLSYTIPVVYSSGHYISTSSGAYAVTSAPGFRATEPYYDVRMGSRLVVCGLAAGGGSSLVCFYTENKTKISSVETYNDHEVASIHYIDIPSGAVYARFSGMSNSADEWSKTFVGLVGDLSEIPAEIGKLSAEFSEMVPGTTRVDYDKLFLVSEMTSYYESGKYMQNGAIVSTDETTYGIVFIPIKKGEGVRVFANRVDTSNVYDAIAFTTSPAAGTLYEVISGPSIQDNLDSSYTALENGYIAIFTTPANLDGIRVYKGTAFTLSDIYLTPGLECENQLPVLNLQPDSNNNFSVLNSQDTTLNFDGKVSVLTTISKTDAGYAFINDYFTSVNDKLRNYANEDGIFMYPIKYGCRVYNSNNHSVKFRFQLRYKLSDNVWRTPYVEKTIAATSYEDFELILFLDLRTTAIADLSCWSRFSDGIEVGDEFTLGNSYIVWYDVKHRDARPFVQPQTIIPGISENQLSLQVQEKLNGGVSYPAFQKRIICSGSSVTWGGGKLDGSMVLFLDKFIRERLSQTILPASMIFNGASEIVTEEMMYNNTGRKISGIGNSIEFDIYGDELAICQMKRRSATDYGVMKVYADNVQIGIFDNKNRIGTDTESFSGSDIREIQLKHPCTFAHTIVVNGVTTLTNIVYNTAGYGGMPPADPDEFEAFVFRALDSDGSPVHRIQFSTALGTINSVNVSYSYGNVCAYEKSTLGQTSDEYTNESYYGDGDTSFDPDQPAGGISSGMEFRAVNKDAFFIHKFTSVAARHIKVEIIDGINPYFIVNFATNRYHDIMNAGIGGWTINALIDDNKVNDYTQFFRYFKPDIIFQESETNDDWAYNTRRIRRNIGEISLADLRLLPWLEVYSVGYNANTNKYDVDLCTGIIDSITYTSLVSQHIIGTSTAVGDIIRIGNYHGDIKQVACRKITEVNLTTGEVKWVEPLSLDEFINVEKLSDLVGAEINIRDLSGYKTDYKEYIEKVHAIAPEAKIVVVENGLPMLYARQLWGYDVIHREIVEESDNATYCDARYVLREGQFATISGARKETITPNGGTSYNLTFAGSNKSWYGFKVLVNGVDVYGKDCYIESQYGYRAKSSLSGADLNKTQPYARTNAELTSGTSMRLVFTQNAPAVGDSVEVWYSDQIWSNDFCHPLDFGAFLYGQAYSKFIQ